MRLRSFPSSKRRQAGLGLLEVLLAITVSLVVGAIAADQLRSSNEAKQATAAGDQLRLVGNALNTYVAMRYDKLVTLTSVGGSCPAINNTSDQSMQGTPNDPGPRCCDAATGFCSINSDTLRRNGLLPNSFSGYNSYGARYVYVIRVQGTAPNYIVDGIVYTDTPYTTTGTTPRYDLLGLAMNQAGADSGMTRSVTNRLEGLNGAWSEANYPTTGSWMGPTNLGLLGYRVGYGTSGYAAYLRLDGASAMTGDLDLGAHAIKNIQRLVINGPAVAGASVLHINSQGYSGDPTNDPNPNAGTDITNDNGSGLVVRNDKGLTLTNRLGTDGGILTAKTGNFTSNINVGSNMITANGLTGTLVAPTINASTVAVTGNVNIKGGYGVQFDVNSDGTPEGGWYMNDTNWVRSINGKGIVTTGEMRANDLTALDHVYVGTVSGAALGGACTNLTTTGSGNAIPISKNASTNELMQCRNGIWTSLSVNSHVVQSTATATGAGTTYAACAANETLLGGGYALVNLVSSGSQAANAPDQSFPDTANKRWGVRGSSLSASTFNAYAVCAY